MRRVQVFSISSEIAQLSASQKSVVVILGEQLLDKCTLKNFRLKSRGVHENAACPAFPARPAGQAQLFQLITQLAAGQGVEI